MPAVVIPVKNEEENIAKTLDNCQNLPLNKIIVILNGCTDNSKEVIKNHSLKKYIHTIEFADPLGIDIPRAIGAAFAYKNNSPLVLFLDGDMQGSINTNLKDLVSAVTENNIDMALTNCYPFITNRPTIASAVLRYRENLNRCLGVFTQLGLANPCHGPHAVSRRLLEKVPWMALAIPPLCLAITVQSKLNVQVATSLSHTLLLSSLRNDDHNIYIAETIIGDCLEALRYLEGLPPSRKDNGIYYLGYHPERKFDVLEEYVEGLGL
ncbi:MAG: hypothetical protein JM58_15170 [Peptococcaceae bacterium BICA1-8]|nr:MAG: hypothetical protein JM58_15170 [Peptococcaceae bacterium BICA1-8]